MTDPTQIDDDHFEYEGGMRQCISGFGDNAKEQIEHLLNHPYSETENKYVAIDGSLHIYAPRYYAYRCMRKCDVCHRRRRMVGLLFEWSEGMELCLSCGERRGTRTSYTRITAARRAKIGRARALYKSTTDNFRAALGRLMEAIRDAI